MKDEAERDLEAIERYDTINKKMNSGEELTPEDMEFLKDSRLTMEREEKVEKKEAEKKRAAAEPIIGGNSVLTDTSVVDTTLDDYLRVSRVSNALKTQLNTKAYMIQAAQFFATMDVLRELRRLNDALEGGSSSPSFKKIKRK